MDDKIKVNLSRTINLGNYESIKIEVGVETSVTNNDKDSLEVIGLVTDDLIASIILQSKKFKRAIKPKKI